MLTGSIIADNLVIFPENGEIYWASRKKRVDAGQEAGVVKDNGYRVICIDQRKYRAHHLVWVWVHGKWPKAEIDHINGNRDDNRIENLREASVAQNRTNKRIQSNNKSGFKWVSFVPKAKRWRAEIRKNRRRIYSSFHSSAEEAYEAACIAAKGLHGPFFNPG